MMNNLAEIIDLLKNRDNFLITGHTAPDGDSIGSVLALGFALRQMDKKVQLAMPDKPADLYAFMPGFATIMMPEQICETDVETFITLDCASPERLHGLRPAMEKAPLVINIDHHISNDFFGHYNYIDSRAAAVGEIIFEVVRQLPVEMNDKIAACLFVAIATDTGSFKYANMTAHTHQVVSMILTQEIDHARILRNLFELHSLSHMRLLGAALSGLKTDCDGRLIWTALKRGDFSKAQADDDDVEGIIDHIKSVEGVEVALLFRETESGRVKIGLRSQEWADVNRIAQRFGGGGHPRAAGCLLDGPIEDAISKFLEVAREVMDCDDGRNP